MKIDKSQRIPKKRKQVNESHKGFQMRTIFRKQKILLLSAKVTSASVCTEIPHCQYRQMLTDNLFQVQEQNAALGQYRF
jgi:hypothetical protein